MESDPEFSPPPPDGRTPTQRLRERLAYCAGASIVLMPVAMALQNVYLALFAVAAMLIFFVVYLLVLIFGCTQFSMLELMGFTFALGGGAALAQHRPTAKWGTAVIAGVIVGAFVIVVRRVIKKEGGVGQG
jgi:hypothetical protein